MGKVMLRYNRRQNYVGGYVKNTIVDTKIPTASLGGMTSVARILEAINMMLGSSEFRT